MVIDTSAIVAILLDEPVRGRFIGAVDAAAVRLVSTASLVEATLVVEGRKGPRAEAWWSASWTMARPSSFR